MAAGGPRRADGRAAPPRGPLRRHAGRRVHRRERARSSCSRPATRSGPAQAAVRFAVDAVAEGAHGPASGAAHDRRGAARCTFCTRPSTRPRSSRCSQRASRPLRAPPRARSSSTAAEAIAAEAEGREVILVRPFTEGRGRRRLPRREGDFDLRGRQGLARGARRPRDGPPGGDGRLRARDRRRERDRARGGDDPHGAGDHIAIDGSHRRDHRRRGPGRRARGLRGVPARARVGRRGPAARGAGKRRFAGGRGARPQLRGPGDRALPDRAHVPWGAPATHGLRDPRRRPEGARPAPSPSCARSSRRTSRGSSRR